jgi:hypothetical protein
MQAGRKHNADARRIRSWNLRWFLAVGAAAGAAAAQQCSGSRDCRAINKSTAEPKRLGRGTSPMNNPIPG